MSRRTKKTKKDHQKKHKEAPKKVVAKKEATEKKGLSIRVLGRPRIESGKKEMADVVVGKEELIEKELLQAREQSQKKEKVKEKPEERLQKTWEEIEKNKRLIMWSGIVFFMVIIIFGWFYNTKKVFEANRLESQKQPTKADWSELIGELGDKMKEMKDNLEAIKTMSNNLASSTEISTASSTKAFSSLPKTDVASSSDETKTPDSEEIKELKETLEEKASKKIRIIY